MGNQSPSWYYQTWGLNSALLKRNTVQHPPYHTTSQDVVWACTGGFSESNLYPQMRISGVGFSEGFPYVLATHTWQDGILLNRPCGTSLCPVHSTQQGLLCDLRIPLKTCMLTWNVSNFRCPGLTRGELASNQASWYCFSCLLILCYLSPHDAGFGFFLLSYSGFPFGIFSHPTKNPYFLSSKLASRRCSSNPASSSEARRPVCTCLIPNAEWLRQEGKPGYAHQAGGNLLALPITFV